MAGKVTNWSLLAGAAAYSIGSTMYGEGVSVSYTALDDYDFWENGAYEASVTATLSFNGSEIDLGAGWDFSLAVAELYMDPGPGLYEVTGDHQIFSYYYGWLDLGGTYDSFDDGGGGGGGGGGGSAMCESSYYFGPTVDGGQYAAQFRTDLGYWDGEEEGCDPPGDTTFYPGTVTENVTAVGSACYNLDTGEFIVVDLDDNTSWGVCPDSSYGCGGYDVDETSFNIEWVDYVQGTIAMGMQAPCSIYYGNQEMSYNGGAIYWVNDLGIDLDGTNGTGIRGNASGSIYE